MTLASGAALAGASAAALATAAQEPGAIRSALASVQARVALLKGSMTSTSPDGLWMASVTNALKHSRGSPIHISIATGETVAVEVVNGAARSMPDRLASSGGGHGLQGIHDRVVGLGGNVEAGPEPGIGWRLRAAFPAR
jgi:hypothetical protein